MKPLSGLDAAFLHLETPEMPMHVGALHVFELPSAYRGDFAADIRRHIAARLPLLAPLRRRLAPMPLQLANPAWVDAMPDLAVHIVSIALPEGSQVADLQNQVAELHPRLLPRDRPLWKFHVFTGLARKRGQPHRFGLYTQLHHAAVDGQAAVALAQAMLDLSAEPRAVDVALRPPRRPPGTSRLIGGMLAHQWQQVGSLVRSLPATVGALASMARAGAGSAAVAAFGSAGAAASPASNLGLAPRTRLNASVGRTRSFATVSLPLAELKVLRRTHDATLNDLVLMLCSGALRGHFTAHGPLPRKPLVAAVPISLRAVGDASANNQASMTLVKLHTEVADAAERFVRIRAATAAMKATLGDVKTLMPTDFPSIGIPWLMRAATTLYGRAKVAEKLPPLANVVISNVPGPACPLYLAGAKMLSNHPTSIVAHGVALNITVQTYDQSLDIGLIACGRALPQHQMLELAGHLHAAFDELRHLAAAGA